MKFAIDFLLLFTTTVISAIMACFSWKRRPAVGSAFFALLVLSISEWSLCQLFQDMSQTLSVQMFFDSAKFLGISIVPVAWFLLTLQHAKINKMITKRNIILLVIIPLMTNLLIWTNQYHGLVFQDCALLTVNGFYLLKKSNGIWFWVHTYYSYLLLGSSFIILVKLFFTRSYNNRKQTGLLILGYLLPFMANILVVFEVVPLPFPDITPVCLSFTMLLYFWALFKYNFLDIIPIAYHKVIKNMKDAIIVLDNNMNIVEINPAALMFLQSKKTDVLGKPIQCILNNWPELFEKSHELLEINEKVSLNVADAVCFFDLQVVQIYDKRQRINGKLVMIRNITETEEFLQKLDKAREAAEAASDMKSKFINNMSHEFCTPMNAIMGMTYLIKQTGLSTKQTEYVNKLERANKHLMEIINDIILVSQIESGELVLEQYSFKLYGLVKALPDIIGEQCASKGIKLTIDREPGLPETVYGDRAKLEKILLLITENAVKFTEQGEIMVGIRKLAENEDNVSVRFEVHDTGIGLSPEQIRMLFQPFQQADASTTRKYGGTGLGLALAKKLVGLMDGDIGVKSVSGEGSVFWFTVELGKEENHSRGIAALPENTLRSSELPPAALKQELILPIDGLIDGLVELKPYLMTHKPKKCAEIMEELLQLNWPVHFQDEVVHLKKLVDKYRFKEAIIALEALMNRLRGENKHERTV